MDLRQIPPWLKFCILTGIVFMIIMAEAESNSDAHFVPLRVAIIRKNGENAVVVDHSDRPNKKLWPQQQRGEGLDRGHRLLKTAVREIRKAVKQAREFEVRQIRTRMKKEKSGLMAKNDSHSRENSSIPSSQSSPRLLSLLRQHVVAKSLDLTLLTQQAALQFDICTSIEQFYNVSKRIIGGGGGGDFVRLAEKTSRNDTTNDTCAADDGLLQTISKRILKRRCIQDCADTHLKELRRFRKFRNFQRRRKQRRVRNQLNKSKLSNNSNLGVAPASSSFLTYRESRDIIEDDSTDEEAAGNEEEEEEEEGGGDGSNRAAKAATAATAAAISMKTYNGKSMGNLIKRNRPGQRERKRRAILKERQQKYRNKQGRRRSAKELIRHDMMKRFKGQIR